jgi:hypothetical protein
MKTKIILFTSLLFLASIANAQIRYCVKLETSYLPFAYTTIKVEPGPSWKGYYLNNKQNGISINLINGIMLQDRILVGLGFGYLNFEGIKGLSLSSEFEYYFLKRKRLNPLLNLKIGYSHIWNQYEGGKSTAYTSYGAGLQYQCSKKLSINLHSGLLFTQQSLFYPISLGATITPFRQSKKVN